MHEAEEEENFSKIIKQSHNTYGHLWRRRSERRYSSYSFTTCSLDGSEWSASGPAHALPPGKGPPVPIGQEAGWVGEMISGKYI
jgi:hypothetical protein